MEEKSRTEYSAINTTVALISRIIAILMGFVTRVVFTHVLNENYVGINGLFTDILNVLSLTELGVGTAITYALYVPIAQKDRKKQQQLMRMYQNFYRATALCVMVVGFALIPFMDVLMKNRPDVDHLILIYLLYLSNSVLSYLLVYKRTLIDAHQMNYIVLVYQTIFLLIQDVCQIIVLLVTRNFILFLSIYIICTVLSNIAISWKADKLFPYLKEPCHDKMGREEKKSIYKNIRAMMMHKLGNVIVNNTDNLLISSFIGVVSVGIYSNYYLVIGSVRQVLDQIFQGITASVGNLGATEDSDAIKNVFDIAFFIGQWLYGFAAICLFELLNPFIEIAFGKNYLFSKEIVLILCINFYINGTRKAALTFRDSMGLFWFDRYKAIVEAVLNLVISLVLVSKFGTFGVFAGTFFSTMLTSVWVEPYVLYRHRLNRSPYRFYLQYFIYALGIGAAWLITDVICGMVQGNVMVQLVVRLGICVVIPNVLLLLFYFRKQEFQKVIRIAKRIIKNRRPVHGTTVE